MRPMQERNASACEHATSPVSSCKCRCGGKLHGAFRGRASSGSGNTAPREFFECLPDEDPHKLPPKVQPDLDLQHAECAP